MGTHAIDTTKKELPDHQPVSAVVVKWPFIAFGVFTILLGAGTTAGLVISTGVWGAEFGWGCWIAMGVGAIAVGIGGLLLASVVDWESRRARKRRAQSRFRDEPWLADYRWRPGGTRCRRPRWVGDAWFESFALPAILILLIINTRTDWRNLGWTFLTACVDVCLVGLLLRPARRELRRLVQWRRVASSFLRFERFPFFLGEALDVRFSNRRLPGPYAALAYTLRFIQEAHDIQRSGSIPSARVVSYQLYAAQGELGVEGLAATGGDEEIPLSVPLPQGDYDTRLGDRPARYWHLEVEAKTAEASFKAAFFVPVYARPAS